MAVLVAESLLERGGLDLPDIFARFQRWAAAEPKDIGLQTEDVLTNGMPWDLASAIHFQVNQRAAGNGSLMRASTSAVYFARAGQEATMDAARRIAALTHGDRAAWEGTAIYHELIRVTLEDIDPLAALPNILGRVHPDHRGRYAAVLAQDWRPDQATEFNGAVRPCLGSAVWAMRTTGSFEEAMRAAIDLGGDTDAVAAVTGGLAGAYYGLDAIPARWSQPLHVPLPGFDGRDLHLADLLHLATVSPPEPRSSPPIGRSTRRAGVQGPYSPAPFAILRQSATGRCLRCVISAACEHVPVQCQWQPLLFLAITDERRRGCRDHCGQDHGGHRGSHGVAAFRRP